MMSIPQIREEAKRTLIAMNLLLFCKKRFSKDCILNCENCAQFANKNIIELVAKRFAMRNKSSKMNVRKVHQLKKMFAAELGVQAKRPSGR